MSAFIVGKDHIDAMVTVAMYRRRPFSWYWGDPPRRGYLDNSTADETGRMLWAENVRSVQHRYPDTIGGGEYPGPIDFSPEQVFNYEWRPVHGLSAVVHQALKVIDCYEYQSCESEDWKSTEAYAFCDSLRRSLICDLPGYKSGPWESIPPTSTRTSTARTASVPFPSTTPRAPCASTGRRWRSVDVETRRADADRRGDPGSSPFRAKTESTRLKAAFAMVLKRTEEIHALEALLARQTTSGGRRRIALRLSASRRNLISWQDYIDQNAPREPRAVVTPAA